MIANLLTISRLLLIPVIFGLIIRDRPAWALVVFAAAAFTDLLDGEVARRRNEVTELGRILDPLTDRLFISAILVALYMRGGAGPPLWALAALVGRDALVLIGAAGLFWKGHRIEVTFAGKTATAALSVAILLMIGNLEAGLWLFYAGLALYLGTGFDYLLRGKKVWASSRTEIQENI